MGSLTRIREAVGGFDQMDAAGKSAAVLQYLGDGGDTGYAAKQAAHQQVAQATQDAQQTVAAAQDSSNQLTAAAVNAVNQRTNLNATNSATSTATADSGVLPTAQVSVAIPDSVDAARDRFRRQPASSIGGNAASGAGIRIS